jgi:hypothetical protein
MCSANLTFLRYGHRNPRTRSRTHLLMQDDQNGQNTMALPSADKTRLTHFIPSKNIYSSKRPSLAADGNNIVNLLALEGLFVKFIKALCILLVLRFLWLLQKAFWRNLGESTFCAKRPFSSAVVEC